MSSAYRLIPGDVRAGLRSLPPQSVHCVVTSPPYWGLRDYELPPQVWGGDSDCDHEWGAEEPAAKPGAVCQTMRPARTQAISDGQRALRGAFCQRCGCWRGCLGLEPTVDQFVRNTVVVFREVWRVLRDDGTLWLNIGDCYATSPAGQSIEMRSRDDDRTFRDKPFCTTGNGLKPKDLVGAPWRVALALQSDGWYLRSDIVWAKTNAMPESMRDRPATAHEHVFLLSKRERYFYDGYAIREPCAESSQAQLKKSYRGNGTKSYAENGVQNPSDVKRRTVAAMQANGGTRNARNVWTINTEPFRDAHFATFPTELVRRCIAAGTSEHGCCPKCGKGWVREFEVDDPNGRLGKSWHDHKDDLKRGVRGVAQNAPGKGAPTRRFIGWKPACKCDHVEDDLRPAVVLDPFSGSGTTGVTALRHGRHYVGCELNPEYLAMSERRLRGEVGLFTLVGMEEEHTR